MRISDWSSDVCSSDLHDWLDLIKPYANRHVNEFMPIGMILFGEPLPTVPPCALVLYTDPLVTVPPSCIAAHLATSWRGPDHAHQARKPDHCGESIRCRAGMANRSGTPAFPPLPPYHLRSEERRAGKG